MFTQLELRSFKCFKFLRLPLAPLTLLTGLNASGKSSVLQAIALLHQTMLEHEWSTRLVLNGGSVRLGAAWDVAGRAGFEVVLEDDESVYRWVFRGDRRDMSMEAQLVAVNGRKFTTPQALRYLLPVEEANAASSFTRSLRNLTYITAERIAPQEAYPLEDPRLVSIVGPRGEHAVSVLHWGWDKPVIEGLVLPEVPNLRLNQVERRMSTLFPGFEIELQQASRANAATLGLRTSKATEFLKPVHTGFGLTQILPIVVAALSATQSDIILIENPEVHLHPAGQVLMGQFLADVAHAGIQAVVETHSDHVLNGVRRAVKTRRLNAEQVAIHFFRSPSDEITQVLSPTLDDSGNIDDWPEGFFDQFDKDANYFAGWAEE